MFRVSLAAISTPRSTMDPTEHPTQCVLDVLSTGIKQPGREVDHSPNRVEVNTA
jgi:hypothetical protein